MRLKRKNIFLIIFSALFLLSTGYLVGYYHHDFIGHLAHKALLKQKEITWKVLKQKIENEINRFKGEVGLVIKDLRNNQEISFNKEKLFASASLAKVPIMAACYLASYEGRLKLESQVTLKTTDKINGTGMLRYMQNGTSFSIEELIGLMIYDSDNTATNILTNLLGIDYLNNKFKEFGLKDTTLSRKVADYKARDLGIENYTTTQDMAVILEKIYHKNLINRQISEKCLKLLKLTRTNDRICAYLPAEVMVAHKTGLERGVCHDVGIVFTPFGDFLICVLTKHNQTTSKLSKELIARISFLTYQYFQGGL